MRLSVEELHEIANFSDGSEKSESFVIMAELDEPKGCTRFARCATNKILNHVFPAMASPETTCEPVREVKQLASQFNNALDILCEPLEIPV